MFEADTVEQGENVLTQNFSAPATSHAARTDLAVEAPVALTGPLPRGWARVADRAAEFVAPARGERPAARLRVLVARDAAGLDAAAEVLIERLVTQDPGRLVVAADVWPHPVFGAGRLVQSAHVEGDQALARDHYLFVHEGLRVQVEVDCPLVDLLAVEDEVAAIVARVGLAVEVAA